MSQSRISRFVDSSRTPSVCGFLQVPASPSGDGFVLTHGAGANCQSSLLVALASAFCESGLTVLRCDLAFRQLRPHGPPPRGSGERDREGLQQAVEAMRQEVSSRVFLGGHSYGGRQATMLAAAEPGMVDGLLPLSYPMHPPRKPEQPRTAHLPDLRTPAFFVHGSRDSMGAIEEMQQALQLIPAPTALMPVEGAGHGLVTARSAGEVTANVVKAFFKFVA
jgi:uncharacterized protein